MGTYRAAGEREDRVREDFKVRGKDGVGGRVEVGPTGVD